MIYCDNIDEAEQFEKLFPEIAKNVKYNEIKTKKLRGGSGESTHNKYLKIIAKGIKNYIGVDQNRFIITKEL